MANGRIIALASLLTIALPVQITEIPLKNESIETKTIGSSVFKYFNLWKIPGAVYRFSEEHIDNLDALTEYLTPKPNIGKIEYKTSVIKETRAIGRYLNDYGKKDRITAYKVKLFEYLHDLKLLEMKKADECRKELANEYPSIIRELDEKIQTEKDVKAKNGLMSLKSEIENKVLEENIEVNK